jgi:uncharacterized protein YbaP (TraB family)
MSVSSDYYVGYFSVHDKAEGLWYTIKDNRGKIVGYLFGTVHIPINNFGEFDPNWTSRNFNYEPKWKRAFNGCTTVALEMSLNDAAQEVFQRLDKDKNDPIAKKYLNPLFLELYENKENSIKDKYKTAIPDKLTCDYYLEQQAYANTKKVVSLENLDVSEEANRLQANGGCDFILNGLPEFIRILIFEIGITFKCIPEWKIGNLSYFANRNPSVNDERETNMANKVNKWLLEQNENEKLFVGIGSGHLLRVAQYLRDKGWTMQKM